MKSGMSSLLHNYLTMHRKRAGLSQQEVARLLTIRTDAAVTRHELGHRLPSARVLMSYEILYGESVAKLFAGCYADVEGDLQDRAKKLLCELDEEAEHPRPRKYEHLAQLAYPDDPVYEAC